MDLGLKGKVALITAASKGIGKAIAMSLAAEGCEISICSRTKEDLLNCVSEIKKLYGIDPCWNVCDLNKLQEIENTVTSTNKNLGKIDILVNNCGSPITGSLAELKEEDWHSAYDQVLLSVVRFCNFTIPDMIAKEWGRIINITSVAAVQPIENLMLSNTLRNGIIGFAKTLSNEVAKYNITVNNIAPGFTLTNRLYELAVANAKKKGTSHEEILSDMAKEIPMNRLARPEEVASVAVFLSSNQAGYLTGNTISVDGGWVKGT
jgi:3-oxoacyl-[acyl-carrier protein] reductase